jgi:transposase-like protein
MKRRTFSKEFKLSILEELHSGKSIANICNEHNIAKDLVYKWKYQYEQSPKRAFSGHGKTSSLEAELNEYKRLVGQLYAEKTFLKKCIQGLREHIAEKKLKERGVLSK